MKEWTLDIRLKVSCYDNSYAHKIANRVEDFAMDMSEVGETSYTVTGLKDKGLKE